MLRRNSERRPASTFLSSQKGKSKLPRIFASFRQELTAVLLQRVEIWSEEEDILLRKLVELHGTVNC